MFRTRPADRRSRTSHPARRSHCRPALEVCEARQLMATGVSASPPGAAVVSALNASGVLEVKGSVDSDTIRVTHSGGWIYYSIDSKHGLIGDHAEVAVRDTGIKSVKIYGYEGKDTIDASGLDLPVEVQGGPDADTIYGGNDGDTIYGQGGNDLIYGNEDNDYLDGGDDNDTIYGSSGDDTLYGEAGNDVMNGNAGRDSVYGYTGQDTIYGVFGEDKALKGNADNDTLYMTFNLDTFYKYKGYDSFAEGISGVDTFYVSMDLGTTGRT